MNRLRFRLLWTALLFGGMFLLLCHGVSAQEAAPAAGAAPKSKTIFETVWESGPLGRLIWFGILAASVTMVTFVIQNVLTLRNDRLAPAPLYDSLKQTLSAGNYQEAWEICNANKNYLANTLKAGLERIGRGKDVFDDALAEHGLREAQMIGSMDWGKRFLSTNSKACASARTSPLVRARGTRTSRCRAACRWR